MKIGIVGAGAVGSYYGALLGLSGQEVHFLLRSDYEVVRERGVTIQSADGDFHFQPRAARSPDEIGPCDLVVIALKTTANDQFPVLLPPLVHPGTMVFTLQNGLGNEEELARLFDPHQILGGLCFVCLNRISPGIIHHLAHGMIVFGEFGRPPEPRTQQLAEVLRRARIPCKVSENLAAAHWEKLVWNIPFNGLGVAAAAGFDAVMHGCLTTNQSVSSCMPTDKLLGEARWEALVKALMLEVIATANALGLGLSLEIADQQIERTREMGAYQASTLVDFERGLALELDSLFQEPLRQARKAGVSTPILANVCAVLKQLDSLRAG